MVPLTIFAISEVDGTLDSDVFRAIRPLPRLQPRKIIIIVQKIYAWYAWY